MFVLPGLSIMCVNVVALIIRALLSQRLANQVVILVCPNQPVIVHSMVKLRANMRQTHLSNLTLHIVN